MEVIEANGYSFYTCWGYHGYRDWKLDYKATRLRKNGLRFIFDQGINIGFYKTRGYNDWKVGIIELRG